MFINMLNKSKSFVQLELKLIQKHSGKVNNTVVGRISLSDKLLINILIKILLHNKFFI